MARRVHQDQLVDMLPRCHVQVDVAAAVRRELDRRGPRYGPVLVQAVGGACVVGRLFPRQRHPSALRYRTQRRRSFWCAVLDPVQGRDRHLGAAGVDHCRRHCVRAVGHEGGVPLHGGRPAQRRSGSRLPVGTSNGHYRRGSHDPPLHRAAAGSALGVDLEAHPARERACDRGQRADHRGRRRRRDPRGVGRCGHGSDQATGSDGRHLVLIGDASHSPDVGEGQRRGLRDIQRCAGADRAIEPVGDRSCHRRPGQNDMAVGRSHRDRRRRGQRR